MKCLVLALTVCPFVAFAQTPAARSGWILEASGGLGWAANGRYTNAIGLSYAVSAGQTVGNHLSWRAAVELDQWSAASLTCNGSVCTSGSSFAMWSASFGVVATAKTPDRGLYATGRLGFYQLATAPGSHLGGYFGAGVAVPMWRGALTLETGLHAYIKHPKPDAITPASPDQSQPGLAVPVRVGFRWLP